MVNLLPYWLDSRGLDGQPEHAGITPFANQHEAMLSQQPVAMAVACGLRLQEHPCIRQVLELLDSGQA